MLKKILIGLLLALGALVLYAQVATSTDFRIVREIKINAPAFAVFPFVNEPKKMNSWNPWLKLDHEAKVEYLGPEAGVGAASTWDGDMQVGAGTATVTHSVPNFLVRMQLVYRRPMQGTSTVDFSLKQEGEITSVDWIMLGQRNWLGKVVCLVMNTEKLIGNQFDSGLADLKSMVESAK